ncbi:MAG: polymer-forming cytoskeletal protein [Muribaculaceae bacterium]|nr:polymer-forming cytoskeletal protein [Muribaculaceae bacterium]MCM1399941.1 polymer-forming cytoskeletal protein [Clostridium sp.]MCM1460743.1 polymer-forming cytoskeletal protein [Bacteroides sp.]
MTNQPISNIIRRNPHSGKIERPTLLLQNNGFETIHKIGNYHNWTFSAKANGMDEISFTVNKYTDNKRCPFWEELSDLKIVEVKDYGRFQIKVSYEDAAQTVKTVTGQSLETELGQLPLYLHVNDEEAVDMVKTEYSSGNYTDEGNFIPTVFYNENDTKHSLLHRVLADKAPHWTIGHVTEYVTKDDAPDTEAEPVSSFQRTYTVDGTSIYDFLTGDVAKETNAVFIFDTFNRRINVYSLYDCYVTDKNGNRVQKSQAIGEDTSILISKKKLAGQISIESNADQLKNCFRVTGGDDIITAYVAAVNMSGDNYIHMFSPYQLNSMPRQLSDAIGRYQKEKSEHENEYTGEDGIFTKLTKAYADLSYYESSMMPKVELTETSAEEQFQLVKKELKALSHGVGVYRLDNYTSEYHSAMDNNVESLAEVYVDSRYDVEVVKGTASYNETTHEWTGVLRYKRKTDETDRYPVETDISELISKYAVTLKVSEDDEINGQLAYTEQKIYKALSKSSIAEIDFGIEENIAKKIAETAGTEIENISDAEIEAVSDTEIRKYFEQFSLNRLKGFAEGYNSCISILCELNEAEPTKNDNLSTETTKTANPSKTLYNKYARRYHILTGLTDENGTVIIEGVIPHRQQQTDDCKTTIEALENQQKEFQETWNFKNYLYRIDPTGGLFKTFASYRRESEYSNANYTSDALVDDNGYIDIAECIKKAKALLDAAEKELQKACMLQRTLSTSMNNLLILPEFKEFHESFGMFNYFRVRTEDELFKMRLVGVDYDESNPSGLSVTFSDQIITLGSTEAMGDDIQSILSQAASIATSYPAVARQSEQGNKAQHTFNELKSDGLNSMLMKIKNSDDEEVTISQSGILCKKMNDEGTYGLKQCRITGNAMAFTDDGWQSMRAGIGEMEITDPITEETHTVYGFVGDAVIGNLLAGQKAYIGDKDGNVVISSEGIRLKGGSIAWETPINQENINGLAGDLNNINNSQEKIRNDFNTFQNDVTASLGVTEITSDAVISPKIGGGYLYIEKDGSYVEIDPGNKRKPADNIQDSSDNMQNSSASTQDTADNTIFKIHVKDNGNSKDIMKVTNDHAEIAGWTIGNKSLYNNTDSMKSEKDGTYIGTDGIRQYQSDANGKRYVNITDGRLTANDAEISGKITATSGTFTGKVTATSGTIGKCSIDSSGNLQVPSANITGKITCDKLEGGTIKGQKIEGCTITAKSFKYSDDEFTCEVADGFQIKNKTENTSTSYSIVGKDGSASLFSNSLTFYLNGNLNGTNGRLSCDGSDLHINNGLYVGGFLDIGGSLDIGTNSIKSDGSAIVDVSSKNVLYFGISDSDTTIPTASSTSVLRGGTVKIYAHKNGNIYIGNTPDNGVYLGQSGSTAITSDENFKQLYDMDSRYEQFFYNLKPTLYKYNTGHRTHIGFGARAVENALKKSGLTTEEFAGVLIDTNVDIGEDEVSDADGTTHFDELYSLRYEEFIALNTAIIQKQQAEIKSLRDEINAIKEALNRGGVL